jgi:hypothetical protein
MKPLRPRACFEPSSISLISFYHQMVDRRLDFVAHFNCPLGGASPCAFHMLLCRFYLKAKTKHTCVLFFLFKLVNWTH